MRIYATIIYFQKKVCIKINLRFYVFKINYEFTFLKEFMLIKQVHQKSVMFVTIGVFKIIVISLTKCLQEMPWIINYAYKP